MLGTRRISSTSKRAAANGSRLSLTGRPRTVATEAWPPNLNIAGARLRPLEVTVVWDEGAPDNVDQLPDERRGRLPFPSESFALISNRHGAFVASEIARVLTPGGIFLTQQVGGNYDDFYDALELNRPAKPARLWNLRLADEQLGAAGLSILDSGEDEEVTSFADVGAFAWYLKAIPWVVEGFAIDTHRPPARTSPSADPRCWTDRRASACVLARGDQALRVNLTRTAPASPRTSGNDGRLLSQARRRPAPLWRQPQDRQG
jgi:hypothetical protein